VSDSFNLQRFVDAQAAVYRQVIEELSRGQKRTHWMWFIFPQIAGLGFSAMAQRFEISSRAEAVAYLEHDLLGPRLLECTRLVLAASEKTITEILGSPDDMKFRSCMTLFDAVSSWKSLRKPSARSIRTGRTVRLWKFWKRADPYRDCSPEKGNSDPAYLFFQTRPNEPDENCRCKKPRKSPSRTAKPCAGPSSRLSIRASPAGSPTSSASPSS
jgi:uncharacterized protein (DUF1810 family)